MRAEKLYKARAELFKNLPRIVPLTALEEEHIRSWQRVYLLFRAAMELEENYKDE